MHDIEMPAPQGARSLHQVGEILGSAGVSLEGGGMWSGTAHYLVADPDTARSALLRAGLGPVTVRPVVIAALDADVPGALGRLMLQLSDAQVTLLAQYSDHDNRKILVVDDADQADRARDALAQAPTSPSAAGSSERHLE